MPYGAHGTGIQGTTTGSRSTTTVRDSTATFLSDGIQVGATIVNISDQSQAQVISVVSNTQLLCTALAGGPDDYWDTGDIYRVLIDDVAVTPTFTVESSLTIQFSVDAVHMFAVRVIDARRHARMREYEIQRHGVDAHYKPALGDFERDAYSGTRIMTEAQVEDYQEEFPEVANMELDYGSTEKRRFIYLRPNEQAAQTPYGLVAHGEAILGASLYHPYRRGDVIRIHDKIWEIAQIPKYEYLRGKEIIGYRLEVIEAKHRHIDW